VEKRTSEHHHLSVFARRLRQARKVVGIAQDKLGVLIGLDEHTASARMSRYESGIHQPPIQTAQLIAAQLSVPLAYLYCDDDRMAHILLRLPLLQEPDLICLENWLEEKAATLCR
jgi:transcriptional regulator with XRE-family HTH domain